MNILRFITRLEPYSSIFCVILSSSYIICTISPTPLLRLFSSLWVSVILSVPLSIWFFFVSTSVSLYDCLSLCRFIFLSLFYRQFVPVYLFSGILQQGQRSCIMSQVIKRPTLDDTYCPNNKDKLFIGAKQLKETKTNRRTDAQAKKEADRCINHKIKRESAI